ncbi:hypothetical protein BKA69DRAFT_1125745 [Paraphysoderma sedebokerense]|nr:hypothetical protein BKA69DRAFT_1125745 [Paraphysoderma sedebokerense]
MMRAWLDSFLRPKNQYSVDNLLYLHQTLIRYNDLSDTTVVIDALREMTELLIWGDKNDTTIVDAFLENNIHLYITRILESSTSLNLPHVTIQVLQTLNIIFENIRNETTMYYLLSNYVNQIITHKFNFAIEEITSYYVTFLRTCSFKLTKDTILFFYNERSQTFDLYSEAIRFFNHHDLMVRTAIRSLTLNIYRVEEPKMISFVARDNDDFFGQVLKYIKSNVVRINQFRDEIVSGEYQLKRLANSKSKASISSSPSSKLQSLLLDHMDDLHYLNDILILNVQSINDTLSHKMITNFIMECYLNPILSLNNPNSNSGTNPTTSQSESDSSVTYNTQCSILFLIHFFQVIRNPVLVNTVTLVLLNPGVLNVSRVWKEQKMVGEMTRKRSAGALGNGGGASSQNNRYSNFIADSPNFKDELFEGFNRNDNINEYREAIMRVLEHPTDYKPEVVLLLLGLITAILKNPVISPETLLQINITPAKILKTRILLNSLTSSSLFGTENAEVASDTVAGAATGILGTIGTGFVPSPKKHSSSRKMSSLGKDGIRTEEGETTSELASSPSRRKSIDKAVFGLNDTDVTNVDTPSSPTQLSYNRPILPHLISLLSSPSFSSLKPALPESDLTIFTSPYYLDIITVAFNLIIELTYYNQVSYSLTPSDRELVGNIVEDWRKRVLKMVGIEDDEADRDEETDGMVEGKLKKWVGFAEIGRLSATDVTKLSKDTTLLLVPSTPSVPSNPASSVTPIQPHVVLNMFVHSLYLYYLLFPPSPVSSPIPSSSHPSLPSESTTLTSTSYNLEQHYTTFTKLLKTLTSSTAPYSYPYPPPSPSSSRSRSHSTSLVSLPPLPSPSSTPHSQYQHKRDTSISSVASAKSVQSVKSIKSGSAGTGGHGRNVSMSSSSYSSQYPRVVEGQKEEDRERKEESEVMVVQLLTKLVLGRI